MASYPFVVWKGRTKKSSQVYRVVAVNNSKHEFEMYCGLDAMGAEIWQELDDDNSLETWQNICAALSLELEILRIYPRPATPPLDLEHPEPESAQ